MNHNFHYIFDINLEISSKGEFYCVIIDIDF